MKEQIYSIPVTDGFREGGECPFCNMYKKLESDAVDYMLGPSYMEDDIRMDTNKTGFCKDHYKKMYDKQNRLGLALMLHTHIGEINGQLEKMMKEPIKAEKKGFFSKNTEKNKISSYLDNITDSCYICNRIDVTFERYFDTFFYLWKNKKEIREFVKESKGFCLEHFSKLADLGAKKLKGSEYEEFMNIIIPIEKENLKRLEGELEHFINKFDYKYKDEPWGTAQDSLIRGITKAASVFVEEEKKNG
ncbi:MAG: hypothetical protein IJ583_02925 [Firmicutes bacterium]|nr:hypothetical protein [Bacillota bacterium]